MQTQSIKFERRKSEICVPKAFLGEPKCFWCNIEDSCKNRLITFVNEKHTIQYLIYGTFLTYLYRVNNSEPFSLKVFIKENASIFRCFQTTIDFLSADMSFEDAIKIALKKRQQLFSADDENHHEVTVSGMKVSIHLLDEFDEYNTSYERGLNILIDRNGNAVIAITSDDAKNECLYSFAKNLPARIKYFLEVACLKTKNSIKELQLVFPSEFDKICYEWNQTDEKHALSQSFVQMFEEQVSKHLDDTAIIFESEKKCYKLLNQKINQLAHFLIQQKVSREEIILICMEPSLELIVGIIAILKAGCAYLPISSDEHYSRITSIFSDLKEPPILITKSNKREKFDNFKIKKFVFLDDLWINFVDFSKDNPSLKITADQLFAIIYTSGTTGRPKGVMLEHRGIVNHILWMQRTYNLDAKTRALNIAPITFDMSIDQIFVPLALGGTLVISKDGGNQVPKYLIKLIIENGITILTIVPTILKLLLNESNGEECVTLQHVFSGGEKLTKNLCEKFFKKTNAYLHNHYGPTEASLCSAYWCCNKNDNLEVVPIGTPLQNNKIYILDKFKQLLPCGVIGELYIGGNVLAKGYLNLPEITKTQFSRNLFLQGEDEKIYATGDMGRWHPKGYLEFIGRIDKQIKLHGFRIELDVIENIICEHFYVEDCIVKTKESKSGEVKLITFVILKEDAKKDKKREIVKSIRRHLKKFLPIQHISQEFIFLKKFILNEHGKLDFNLMIQESNSMRCHNDEKSVEQNSIASNLQNIWREVLDSVDVGEKDDFFESGGSSYLAIYLISKIRRQLKINLEINEFLHNATIEKLSDIINKKQRECTVKKSSKETKDYTSSTLVLLKKEKPLKPLFLIHPISGEVFLYKKIEEYIKNRSFYGIRNPKLASKANLFESIMDLASYYLKCIKSIQPTGPYLIGGYSFGANIAVEIAKQLEDAKEEIAFLGLIDGWAILHEIKEHQNMRVDQNLAILEFCLDPDMRRFLLALIKEYTTPLIKSKITLFKALEFAKDIIFKNDSCNFWQNYASCTVDVHLVSGNHYNMFEGENFKSLGCKLERTLSLIHI